MKKIISALMFSAIIVGANAQSLQKGNMVIGLGGGLGIYHTTLTDKTNPNNLPEPDTSGAWVFPVTFEYAILDWVGVGARLSYSNYIVGEDSGTTEKARAIDFYPFVNIHFAKLKHIDLFASAEFGYSNFKYTATYLTYSATAAGSGTGYSFGLNSRFYFGSGAKFGMHMRFAWEGFNYKNGVISDTQGSPVTDFNLKANGKVFGLGLQYKIGE